MKFIIKGGKKLNGSVKIRGAKNAATKMMIASLLTDEPVILNNFPFIGDTKITAELCKMFGSRILEDVDGRRIKIHTPEIKNHIATDLSRRNRIPILAIGPLLARVKKAVVPLVGGDKIGPRPVDLHILALETLGAKVKVKDGAFHVNLLKGGLRGGEIAFPFPSVGATETAILSSVLAKGATVLYNVAIEPEVVDLIKMLQKMGAIIEIGADRIINIEGVRKLYGVEHTIIGDRNEAVSFASLAIASNGEITLKGIRHDELITFLNATRRVGGDFRISGDGITFVRNSRDLKPVFIETSAHPGFMTDWQQPFAVLLTQAKGKSIIHETIYEDRFGYIDDLNKMGSNITKNKDCLSSNKCRFDKKGYYHSVIINGPTKLKGANLKVRDLRSGMTHVIAALVADGESVIDGVEEIDRGYEDLDVRLQNLGADIRREA